jgi:LPXTG-site transpeptidase (sortase) family protein
MGTITRNPSPSRVKKQKTPNIGMIGRVLIIVVILGFAAIFMQDLIKGQSVVSAPSRMDEGTPVVSAASVIRNAANGTPILPTPTPAPKSTLAKSANSPYKFVPGVLTLKIPRLAIDAPIIAINLNDKGEVEPPNGPDIVGWYSLSPPPGAPGNSVLAGHVDWKTQTAVFWELRNIKAGDTILVSNAEKGDTRYTVEWVKTYKFDEAPIDTIFASLYEPALTIITCSGEFDTTTHNYNQRLVVRAKAG